MITLDEVNEIFYVASDAEQEGRLEIAGKLRDEAWTGLGMEPSDDPIMNLGSNRTAILEAACRGVIARGYRPDECRIEHYPDGSVRLTVMTSYSSLETYPERLMVLEIRDTSWQPPLGGNIGFQWRGPNWPPWRIDPSESEAWLAEWTERAREQTGAWLKQQDGR